MPQNTSSTVAPREHGLEGRAKQLERRTSEVREERLGDEVLERPAHDVDGNRVGADDEQRERPPLPSLQLDDGVEGREHQDHEAAAVERVRGGPDPLDDGIDVQPLEQRGRDSVSASPAAISPFSLSRIERDVFSHIPDHIPSIIVASVGMKLSVDQPPSLKRNGSSRGNRLRNHTSNAHDRFEFLLKWARNPSRGAASRLGTPTLG